MRVLWAKVREFVSAVHLSASMDNHYGYKSMFTGLAFVVALTLWGNV
jgi:hypothetical protein